MKNLKLPVIGIALEISTWFLFVAGSRLQWFYQRPVLAALGTGFMLAGVLAPIIGTLLGIITLATKPRTKWRMSLGAVAAFLPAALILTVILLIYTGAIVIGM